MEGTGDVIAVFDFDGTLTRRDTLIDFLLQTFGLPGLAAGLLGAGPVLLTHALGLTADHAAKEALFGHYFKGWRLDAFDGRCEGYAAARLPGLMKPDALARCDWHQRQGHRLVCVSASIRNWIAPWALPRGFSRVIATEVETAGGALTGRFRGRNCQGPEKVRRFLEVYPARDRYTLFVYGDSRGDEALLALADHAFFRRYA